MSKTLIPITPDMIGKTANANTKQVILVKGQELERIDFKDLAMQVGVEANDFAFENITLTTPKPTKKGFYFPTEAGVYANFGGIEVTEEKLEQLTLVIIFDGINFELREKSFPALGEVKEGDERAVSGGEVYDYVNLKGGFRGIISSQNDAVSIKYTSAIKNIIVWVKDNINDVYSVNRVGLTNLNDTFAIRIYNVTKGVAVSIFSESVIPDNLIGVKQYIFEDANCKVDLLFDWDIFGLTALNSTAHPTIVKVYPFESTIIPIVDLTPFQLKIDSSLSTTEKSIKGAINELNADKVSTPTLNVYQQKEDALLNTTDKSIKGAINELKSTKAEVSALTTSNGRITTLEGGLATTNSNYSGLQDLVNNAIDGDIQGVIDSAIMATNIESKLNAKETEYAPRLTSVESGVDALFNRDAIFLSDRGVSHTNTATNNTTLIQQAIIDAEAAGRSIVFPYCPAGTFIDINDNLFINIGGIDIIGNGYRSEIKLTNFPRGGFVCTGNNVTFTNLRFRGVTFSGSGMGAKHIEYAGITITGDNVKVKDIFGEQLSSVVVIGATTANGITGGKTTYAENIEILNCGSGPNVVFNLLFSKTKNLQFDNIYGSYRLMPGVATPPHLIYGSNSTVSELPNINVKGGRCYAYSGSQSFAFQFKAMEGGRVEYLEASDCEGFLNIMDCNNFTVEKSISYRDVGAGLVGSVSMNSGSGNKINNLELYKVTGGRALTLTTSNGNHLKNIKIRTLHDVDATDNDVHINGSNNILENFDVQNLGTGKFTSSIYIFLGSNNLIINPKTSGNTRSVFVRHSVSEVMTLNNIINYLPSNLAEPVLIDSPVKMVRTGAVVKNLVAYDYCEASASSASLSKFTQSGQPYTQLVINTWKTENGLIRNVNTTTDNVLYIDTTYQNIDLSAKIKYINNDSLAVRIIGNTNYLYARLNHLTQKAMIGVRSTTGSYIVAEVPFKVQVGRKYNHRLVAFGDYLEFFVDGVLVCAGVLSEAAMTKFGTITNHGLNSPSPSDGTFENIEWRLVE